MQLAVHGGAWNIPDELWQAHRDGCERAHRAGMNVLERGGSAVDAVVEAICVMEDDPVFDAGRGSFLNENGDVELDAGIMEGDGLRSGAVLGVNKVANPIRLARWIMDHSPHCLFSGEGAHRMAQRAGFAFIDPETLILERERSRLNQLKNSTQGQSTIWREPGDTVGAIAQDRKGHFAAGNSTGGTPNKAVGRVGDAALIGSGFYADNQRGAFVCTGWGETIMRSAMGMTALTALQHMTSQAAADVAIRTMSERIDGYGGILLMAHDGSIGMSHSTQRMAATIR